MAEDPRFRRIAKRPERDHLPFELGHRSGPLFAPNVVALALCVAAGCGLAAGLTWVLQRWP